VIRPVVSLANAADVDADNAMGDCGQDRQKFVHVLSCLPVEPAVKTVQRYHHPDGTLQ
jgi:hypothetical protein